mmetsp:Transcript_39048/g.72722  ORF Transcript_39048/g.72722 Transcript_39048/m.72722 type:complete len:492 (+) Transcript_39048:66-1541(+)
MGANGHELDFEKADCSFLLQVSFQSESRDRQGPLKIPSYLGPGSVVVAQALTVVSFGFIACVIALLILRGPKGHRPRSPARMTGVPLHIVVLMGLTMSLDFICSDQYQPSMPDIALELGVSEEKMASSIQAHQLSLALAMFVAGHAAELGRRPVIIVCQLLFTVSAFACACAPSWGWFLAGRVLQGFAASASVAVSGVLRDSYGSRIKMARAATLISSIALIGHIAGPAAGGYLSRSNGWRFAFLMIAGMSLVLNLANYVLLEETLAPEIPGGPVELRPIWAPGTLSWRQRFVLIGLSLLRGTAYVIACVNGFIFKDVYHLSLMKSSFLMSLLVAAGAFGMAASTTLEFSSAETLRLFSPMLLLSAIYSATVGRLLIRDNPLTYMTPLALHQFLAHGPTWAVMAEAHQENELDDAGGLPPHIYAAGMNIFASLFSLAALTTLHSPSSVLYLLAIMCALSQVFIRAGNLWGEARKLGRQDSETASPIVATSS